MQNPEKFGDRAKALVIVIAFHLAVGLGILYHYRDSYKATMAINKKAATSLPVSKNLQAPIKFPKPSAPQNDFFPPSTTGEEPYVYSWKDDKGILHYSDNLPTQEVAELKRKSKIVPKKTDRPMFSGRIMSSPRTSKDTRVAIFNNSISVPVRLGYSSNTVETNLTLDTGVSRTMLHRTLADRLGLQNRSSSMGIVADGRKVPTETAMLDFIEVGPYRLDFLEVSIVNYQGEMRDTEGLLGINFLKYVHYDINYRDHTISWRRQGEEG